MTSTIKVNTVTTESGSTLTLGESGKTIALASGASQTGFGRTGTVDWQTSIKTSTITAVNGEGYFVNTTGGAITANLPAGTAGSIVAFKDYLGTFDSNALTIAANGSQKINGDASIDLEVNTEGESITLVYADDTQGWLVVNDGNNDAGQQAAFVTATGGTITEDGNFKVHTFTGPGTFTVTCAGNTGGSNEISYLVVAGGGSGAAGGSSAGGGGAGGFREGKTPQCTYSQSPLACTGGANNGLSVTATGYPVTVGGGGAGVPNPTCGNQGSNSVFAGSTTITSTGGGYGSKRTPSTLPGGPGGSGGGAGNSVPGSSAGGSGNTPPVSPSQGNNGGAQGPNSGNFAAGGGGGAGAVGGPGAPNFSGNGGDGVATSITGSSVTRAGGGGGQRYPAPGGPGGCGGAGGGGDGHGGGGPNPSYPTGVPGTANTGGGGGGAEYSSGAGGSGIVVIRYKFQ